MPRELTSKEKAAQAITIIGMILVLFFPPSPIFLLFYCAFYLYYLYKSIKREPCHKDWPYAIFLLFGVQTIFIVISIVIAISPL